MLEIEHRRARSREVEFGSDCPARRGQRGNPFCNPRPRFARYVTTGLARPTVYRRRRFPDRCTRADVELPASVDEAHETLSGPANRRILEREVQLYGEQEYARLAAISVAHLNNLRKCQRYRARRLNYVKTRPTAISIGERRKPQPQGQPGYLRMDTVYRGDRPGGSAGAKRGVEGRLPHQRRR
jgi:hypothetical protein